MYPMHPMDATDATYVTYNSLRKQVKMSLILTHRLLSAIAAHTEGLCPSASVAFLYPADTRMLRMLPRGSLRSPKGAPPLRMLRMLPRGSLRSPKEIRRSQYILLVLHVMTT